MTAEVRAADAPVDATHGPLPRSSSTMVWINGCWTCCGFGRPKRSTAPSACPSSNRPGPEGRRGTRPRAGRGAEGRQARPAAVAADDDLVGALVAAKQPLGAAGHAAARAAGD